MAPTHTKKNQARIEKKGEEKGHDLTTDRHTDQTYQEAMKLVLEGTEIERKQAVESLRRSEERFDLAVKGANDGLWDWPDLNKDDEWWSPRWYELLGYQDGEVKASYSNFQAFLHPDDLDRMKEAVHRHFKERVPFDMEYRLKTKSGTYRWFRGRGQALWDKNGKPIRMSGSIQDITAYKQAEEKVRESSQQLRNLAARLLEVREQERSIIAREIHDEFGQSLTSLKLDLSWLSKQLSEKKQLADRIQAMIAQTETTLDQVRRLATYLRPTVLDDLGLEAAIEFHVREFTQRTGCECKLALNMDEMPFDHERDTILFRILQEALTNVARHAEAKRVDVILEQEDGQLILEVTDDGKGITHEAIKSSQSIGLIGMRERINTIGGRVRMRRIDTGGTQVRVNVPIHQERIHDSISDRR